ncbi:glycosyltransferase family 4 protein [candidate division WWE3 bacterium]|uniref:Glycosyltransferase family 4 protein n=1 Tax=candidate division WWE3 bacterium TaxID=2053526 RepID=A0A955LVC7_UNCKA|nr:glycosyltransferase family 4 protein [candidate division WWE3 bacterium]
MNIIHITHGYPPQPGGVQKVTQEIARRLVTLGHHVTVFACAGKTKVVDDNGVQVTYLAGPELAHTPLPFGLFSALLKVPKDSILHVHIAKAFLPEVTYFISKLRNMPYIAHFHLDVDATGAFGFLLPFYKKIALKRVLNSAVKVIVLSEAHKEIVCHLYRLIPEKVIVVPNGVSNEFYLEKEHAREVQSLLYVGRLQAQKNLPVLVSMMEYLPKSMELHIVGDGEMRSEVERCIKDKNITNATLHGPLYEDDLRAMYQRADVFVLASEREGLPLVLVEAMAAGVPVVASNVSGTREFVEDAGVLVESITGKDFARAIMTLVNDDELRKKLITKAKAKAQAHDWDTIVSQINEVYKEVQDASS